MNTWDKIVHICQRIDRHPLGSVCWKLTVGAVSLTQFWLIQSPNEIIRGCMKVISLGCFGMNLMLPLLIPCALIEAVLHHYNPDAEKP